MSRKQGVSVLLCSCLINEGWRMHAVMKACAQGEGCHGERIKEDDGL